VIYQVICEQNHMTNMYTEKSKARTVFKYVLMTTTMLFLRTSLNGSHPIFTEQDNPASFAKNKTTRLLTSLYLSVLNLVQLLCPSTLSYDWQLGSIHLVTSCQDRRNIGTAVAMIRAVSKLSVLA